MPFGEGLTIERNQFVDDARELRSFRRAGLPAVRAGNIFCVVRGVESSKEENDRWQFLAWVPIFLRHPVQDRWLPLDQLLHRRPLRWILPSPAAEWVCHRRDEIEDRQLERGTHSDLR